VSVWASAAIVLAYIYLGGLTSAIYNAWWQRPSRLGAVVLALVVVLNIAFW
jgi:hypothetical protein